MWSSVSCGSVIHLPSSFIVLYSRPLHPLALFRVSHMMLGFIFALFARFCSLLFIIFVSSFSIAFLSFFWLSIYLVLVSIILVLFCSLHDSSKFFLATFLLSLSLFISSCFTLFTLSVLILFSLFVSLFVLFFLWPHDRSLGLCGVGWQPQIPYY